MIQTWGSASGGRHTCECGAVYEVTRHRLPVRDSDSMDCYVCGKHIDSWNSTEYPSYRLVHDPRKADPEKPE